MNMLEAEDIVFSYAKGQKPVLDHVSLSVGPEERVGILGPSGYGKTTLMKILAGYQKPDSAGCFWTGGRCRREATVPSR